MEAQSLSQTIDLGAIGTALEAQGCDGGAPTLPPSDVPPPVQAESTNGNQSQANSITPQSSPDGLGIGNESANATTQPDGHREDDGQQHLSTWRTAQHQRA